MFHHGLVKAFELARVERGQLQVIVPEGAEWTVFDGAHPVAIADIRDEGRLKLGAAGSEVETPGSDARIPDVGVLRRDQQRDRLAAPRPAPRASDVRHRPGRRGRGRNRHPGGAAGEREHERGGEQAHTSLFHVGSARSAAA